MYTVLFFNVKFYFEKAPDVNYMEQPEEKNMFAMQFSCFLIFYIKY